ncbi:hypothetical protein [Photorhabdus hindustanensis]|uniref:hypothetical protein n=1 Tax=Photorhabdus hindustanensis TaxID=2918802 RepID=UPI0015E3BC22|nr:hypothetical protein [Photorhabdus hindustanensis]
MKEHTIIDTNLSPTGEVLETVLDAGAILAGSQTALSVKGKGAETSKSNSNASTETKGG